MTYRICLKCGAKTEEQVCPECGRDVDEKGVFGKLGDMIKKYPLASLALVGIIVLAIVGLSVIAAASGEIRGAMSGEIETSIVVEYDKNLLFNKYEVRVSIDDSVLGTIKQGETSSFNVLLTGETHTITFSEVGNEKNSTSASFSVSKDYVPYFYIKAARGGIAIRKTDSMTFSEAYSLLKN